MRGDTSPPPGHRGGKTFCWARDYARLNIQAADVWSVMTDRKWHTLSEIAKRTGHPEASVSARLRDFRKKRFGKHIVEAQRAPNGAQWIYRLVVVS